MPTTRRVVDLLFTVHVGSQPFADQLLLTNVATSVEDTTNNAPVTDASIVQVTLTEPDLNIRKGVVATDDPNCALRALAGR